MSCAAISPASFFQSNVWMAEKLVEVVKNRVLARDPAHVVDLYCGVGTLSLPIAREKIRVTGVEAVEDAVR